VNLKGALDRYLHGKKTLKDFEAYAKLRRNIS
jgi:hypothetical protein